MWSSVIEMMADQAERFPEAVFARFLDANAKADTYTYAMMWQLILRWADLLVERGVKRGSRLMLMLPNSADFVGAYFGTLLVAGIPAALHPVRRLILNDPYLKIIDRRMRFIGASALVLPEGQADLAGASLLHETEDLKLLTSHDLPDLGKERSPDARSNDFGLFQFTSGTSGEMKVAQLTHAALLAQVKMISEALHLIPLEESAVSWLPLYHDMGLIGYLLTTASVAASVNLIQTEDFIMRPGLWIKALSDYAATITGGPPSGFLMVARRMKDSEIAQYHLDQVRVALIGAEMVTKESVDLFYEKFAGIGLRRTSLMPTYGMAENGLAVTMPSLQVGPEFENVDLHALEHEKLAIPATNGLRSRSLASVGMPLNGIDVAIVNEAGEPIDDQCIGEISVRSPSLMSGYFCRPDLTNQVLRDGWLFTGDMGYRANGKLFITGRKKDILIVGGQNYYPDDLEEVAKAVPGVRNGRAVAGSYADARSGTEAVVLLAETSVTGHIEREILRMNIRKALAGSGYPITEVVLLRPKTILFTPNGKLMRTDCVKRYLAGEFYYDREMLKL